METDHAPELLLLLSPHDLRTHLLVGNVIGIGTGFCILVQMGIVLFSGIAEQGQPIIKDRGWGYDLAAAVIPQDAEVAEMPVLIVNQRVKHQHTAKLLGKLCPQLVIVVKTGGNTSRAHNAPDGDICRVDVGKQPALRGRNAFPVL